MTKPVLPRVLGYPVADLVETTTVSLVQLQQLKFTAPQHNEWFQT